VVPRPGGGSATQTRPNESPSSGPRPEGNDSTTVLQPPFRPVRRPLAPAWVRAGVSAYLLPLALFLVGAGGGAAQEGIPAGPAELSLEEALRLAREFNPDFRTQASQLESARWQTRAARGDLLPSASVSNSYGYQASGERRLGSVVLAEQPDFVNSSYNVNLSYSMNGTTLLRPGQARVQEEAAVARVDGAALGLQAEVTNAYLAVLRADEQVAQAETALERVRLSVRQAEALVQVGAGTPLDIRRAQVQEGQAEVQLVQSQNQAAASRLALTRLLGVELPADVRLVTPFQLFEPELDEGELVRRAMEGNPVLRASRRAVDAADTGVRAARSQYLPNLAVSAGVSASVFQARDLDPLIATQLSQQGGRFDGCLQDNRIRDLLGDPLRDCAALNPESPMVQDQIRRQVESQNSGFPFGYQRQPWSVSLTLSLPLFTGLARQQQVEEARVAASNAREQVRSEELRLRTEISTALRSVETARRTAELQERIRATAGEELRLAQERFRLGLASSLEVADAQTNLSQAERDEITALYDFHQAVAALEALVGAPVR
jgi:outer membrane protein